MTSFPPGTPVVAIDVGTSRSGVMLSRVGDTRSYGIESASELQKERTCTVFKVQWSDQERDGEGIVRNVVSALEQVEVLAVGNAALTDWSHFQASERVR